MDKYSTYDVKYRKGNDIMRITNDRLIELCTMAIQGLLQDDEESAMEYFKEEMEMTEEEMDFFGVGGFNYEDV